MEIISSLNFLKKKKIKRPQNFQLVLWFVFKQRLFKRFDYSGMLFNTKYQIVTFVLKKCIIVFFSLKMLAIQSVETSGTVHPKRHIPHDRNLKQYRCENLKCCVTKILYTHVALPGIKNRLGVKNTQRIKKMYCNLMMSTFNYSTQSPWKLRHFSYHGTNFCVHLSVTVAAPVFQPVLHNAFCLLSLLRL